MEQGPPMEGGSGLRNSVSVPVVSNTIWRLRHTDEGCNQPCIVDEVNQPCIVDRREDIWLHGPTLVEEWVWVGARWVWWIIALGKNI